MSRFLLFILGLFVALAGFAGLTHVLLKEHNVAVAQGPEGVSLVSHEELETRVSNLETAPGDTNERMGAMREDWRQEIVSLRASLAAMAQQSDDIKKEAQAQAALNEELVGQIEAFSVKLSEVQAVTSSAAEDGILRNHAAALQEDADLLKRLASRQLTLERGHLILRGKQRENHCAITHSDKALDACVAEHDARSPH